MLKRNEPYSVVLFKAQRTATGHKIPDERSTTDPEIVFDPLTTGVYFRHVDTAPIGIHTRLMQLLMLITRLAKDKSNSLCIDLLKLMVLTKGKTR